jgi:ABC-type spermidine/putrescine transport system permease subunit II
MDDLFAAVLCLPFIFGPLIVLIMIGMSKIQSSRLLPSDLRFTLTTLADKSALAHSLLIATMRKANDNESIWCPLNNR